jgi:hypothetical protein
MAQVPQIDVKGIFERAAGHPAVVKTIIVVGNKIEVDDISTSSTLSGVKKPGGFSITPRRKEQFFI